MNEKLKKEKNVKKRLERENFNIILFDIFRYVLCNIDCDERSQQKNAQKRYFNCHFLVSSVIENVSDAGDELFPSRLEVIAAN